MARAKDPIRVVDLALEQEPLYFVCLEDWAGADLADAGDHKERWYRRAKANGLRVKLAVDRDRATLESWGQSDALFVDGELIRTGPPPSQEKLDRLVAKRVERL